MAAKDDMKTPVSILCISDLHFNNRLSSPLKTFGEDLLAYVHNDEDISSRCWIPDYIVISGDITNKGNLNYAEPEKYIDELLELFRISRDRVIMVPGNHDKDTKKIKTLKAYEKERTLFDDFEKNVSRNKKFFWEHYSFMFKDYLSFCRKYASDQFGVYEYDSPSGLFPNGEDLSEYRLLSGVRRFKEDSLSFVLVNTEWLYYPPSGLRNLFHSRFFGRIRKLLSVKEDCRLCAPLVNDAYKLIRDKFCDDTVITVMHRDFKDLSWGDVNHTDPAQLDPVSQLKAISDVILTGHEHHPFISPPTYVDNRVQHISIGSTGIESLNKQIPIRTAYVVRINPARGDVEMLTARYREESDHWVFVPDGERYPMGRKPVTSERPEPGARETVLIRAKSIDNKVIEQEILDFFRIKEGDRIHFCPIRYKDKESLMIDLENALGGLAYEDMTVFVVIYRIISKRDSTMEVYREVVEKFKENHRDVCLTSRVILNNVNVIVPNWGNFGSNVAGV